MDLFLGIPTQALGQKYGICVFDSVGDILAERIPRGEGIKKGFVDRLFACSFGGNVWMDYGCEWTGRKALGECIQIEHTSGFGIDHAEFFMVGIFEISICRQSLSG